MVNLTYSVHVFSIDIVLLNFNLDIKQCWAKNETLQGCTDLVTSHTNNFDSKEHGCHLPITSMNLQTIISKNIMSHQIPEYLNKK